MAPSAALAVPPLPVITTDATPSVPGSQIDPSVAITPTGQRLIAVTDADPTNPHVRVWKRNVEPTTGEITWSGTQVADAPARQPAIAWDGGAKAYLATASSPGCSAAAGVSIRDFVVGPPASFGSPEMLNTFNAGATQTWPRIVLADKGDDTRPGAPIVVTDEEDCTNPYDPSDLAKGNHHDVLVAWRPTALSAYFPRPVGAGHHPDVAVLGSGVNGTSVGTEIAIAYLSDTPLGSDPDVLVRQCTITGPGVLGLDCTAPAIVEPQIALKTDGTPGSVTVPGATIGTTAAPSISCDAGRCHVVWTEFASSGNRTRVFYSSAVGVAGTALHPLLYPTAAWSTPQAVASSAGSGVSQFMPSVAAHGTRADVVYLDTRNGTFDAFQTSLSGAARGRDILLTDANAPSASVGQRLEIGEAGTPQAPLTDQAPGIAVGYFPAANTVLEATLPHGTTPPTLPAGPDLAIGKNTTANVNSWLNWNDLDGDPVTLTVDDPVHGTVASGFYTPDPTYAGTDTIRVRASDGTSPEVIADHPIAITNDPPVFDAPAPAIVDEGGATVTVPLHAVDPDVNDTIVYSVVRGGDALLTAAGRATIVGASLQLKIGAGVRSLTPLQITLRASDTTTGAPARYQDQYLSVTIRPDLRIPSTLLPESDINVTGARASMTADVVWDDPSKACLTAVPRGCHVRRVWNFGDGTPSATTTDQPVIAHDYPRSGTYNGQVTTWVLWGSAQVASPPKSFTVTVHDDGRVVVAIDPTIKRLTRTKRQVTVKIRARATGTAWITFTYSGHQPETRPIVLKAGSIVTKRFNVSLKGLKSRRATIKISGWGMLASNVPPTNVYRTIILQ